MMRVELVFENPLTTDERLRVRLGLGTIAKIRRFKILRGDRNVLIEGDALARPPILEALADVDLRPASIITSLEEAAEADNDDSQKRERVRAIGR